MKTSRFIKILKCKKGSSEIISFVATLPLYISVLMMFVYFIQIGIAAQTLEQAVYTASRVAVLQNDLLYAKQAAEFTADAALRSAGIMPITTEVDLSLVAGGDSGSGGGIRWEHGSLLKTEVAIQFNAFGTRRVITMSSELVMMIERPLPVYD